MSETQPQVLVIKQWLDESNDAFEQRVSNARNDVARTPDDSDAPLIIYSVPHSNEPSNSAQTTAFA